MRGMRAILTEGQDKGSNFEVNTLFNRKPVKLVKSDGSW